MDLDSAVVEMHKHDEHWLCTPTPHGSRSVIIVSLQLLIRLCVCVCVRACVCTYMAVHVSAVRVVWTRSNLILSYTHLDDGGGGMK